MLQIIGEKQAYGKQRPQKLSKLFLCEKEIKTVPQMPPKESYI